MVAHRAATESPVEAVAWCVDLSLATGHADGSVRLWRFEAAAEGDPYQLLAVATELGGLPEGTADAVKKAVAPASASAWRSVQAHEDCKQKL